MRGVIEGCRRELFGCAGGTEDQHEADCDRAYATAKPAGFSDHVYRRDGPALHCCTVNGLRPEVNRRSVESLIVNRALRVGLRWLQP
jgi:hypothetical protein